MNNDTKKETLEKRLKIQTSGYLESGFAKDKLDDKLDDELTVIFHSELLSQLQELEKGVREDIKGNINLPSFPQAGKMVVEHINQERQRIRSLISSLREKI